MTEQDQNKKPGKPAPSADSILKPDEAPEETEPKKKPWELAPRTGQRHANPFQRKTK